MAPGRAAPVCQSTGPLVSQSNTSAGRASNVSASRWCCAVIFRQQRCCYHQESTAAPVRFAALLFHWQDRYRELCQEICLLHDVQREHLFDSMNTTLRCHNGVTDGEQGGGNDSEQALRTVAGNKIRICAFSLLTFCSFAHCAPRAKCCQGPSDWRAADISTAVIWRWTRSRTGKRENMHLCGELSLYSVSEPHVEETPRNPSALTCLLLTLKKLDLKVLLCSFRGFFFHSLLFVLGFNRTVSAYFSSLPSIFILPCVPFLFTLMSKPQTTWNCFVNK